MSVIVINREKLSTGEKATLKNLGHAQTESKTVEITGPIVRDLAIAGIIPENNPVLCATLPAYHVIDLCLAGYSVIEFVAGAPRQDCAGAYVYAFKQQRAPDIRVSKQFYPCPLPQAKEKKQDRKEIEANL